jgi:hypothetical protein
MHKFNTAILFLTFNRLEKTKQVFNEIKNIKPTRLYIASDGPRYDNNNDVLKISEIREYLLHNIDWECDLFTLFRNNNLGCKIAVSQAISWFFKYENEGIILEDDCVPNSTFFYFCQNLLHKYREVKKISLISGDGRGTLNLNLNSDYSFTRYPLIWGWATWKRVWDLYDVDIKLWPIYKKNLIKKLSYNKNTQRFWIKNFNFLYNNKIDTWDFQLFFLLLKTDTLCIIPRYNLIRNIGFGEDATHTKKIDNFIVEMKLINISNYLKHPEIIITNVRVDSYFEKNVFYEYSLFNRVLNKLKKYANCIYKY